MKPRRWLFLAVLGLLALFTAAPLAQAQERVDIEGQIENGTPGEVASQGLTVNLEVFRLGDRVENRETLTEEGGHFGFKGVPGGQGFGYIISTQYQGATYSFERDYPLSSEPVKLVVWESTSSSEAIRVMGDTLVMNWADSKSRSVNFLELVSLENTGDRTFVPDIAEAGPMTLLRFSLPPGTQELDVQSVLRGGHVVQVDLGFALTTPVPPGAHEVAYTYLASYQGDGMAFSHAFPFGADTFRVMVLQGVGQARGAGLRELEPVVLGERRYQRLETSALSKGDTVTLEFTGLPVPSLWERWRETVSGADFLKVFIAGSFGVALVAILIYGLRIRKGPFAAAPVVGDPLEEHRILTEAIAWLDDRFQGQEMEEGEYVRRRLELKAQLLRLATSRLASGAQDISGGGHRASTQAGERAEEE